MGGVSVDSGGKGGRRAVDAEINLIPMIDFLMVVIAFLLISAVWSQMARLNADAQVPGPPRPDVEQENVPPEKQLHVEMRQDDKFVLVWKQGSTVVNSIDVARNDQKSVVEEKGKLSARYPELASRIAEEWKNVGSHRDPSDRKLDQAVLHTDNQTEYFKLIGVIDAIYQAKRQMTIGGKTEDIPAFNVTFSVN